MLWLKIIIDMFFVMMAAFNFAHDIENSKWLWMIFDGLLLLLWMYFFCRDTENLRR